MRDAQGVAIFPGVLKAGLMVGGRYGRGVLVLREPGGTWGKPVFITITGGGVGWQVGIQSTDLVLVFKTRTSLDRILKAQVKLTLGADVAVAAGPVGRQAEAATDAQLRAEIYSYSRSRGLFLGVSVEGAAIVADTSATEAYYRTAPVFVPDPRTGAMVPVMPPEEKLRLKLASWCASAPPPLVVPTPPPPAAPR
jgi:lipid-binding SYLF domain-containing protein